MKYNTEMLPGTREVCTLRGSFRRNGRHKGRSKQRTQFSMLGAQGLCQGHKTRLEEHEKMGVGQACKTF